MEKRSLGITVLAALLLAACGQPVQQQSLAEEGTSQAIVNGTPVDSSDPIARSTIAIYAGTWTAGGKVRNYCSGTLIGRRLVLTAAHCIVEGAEASNVSQEVWMRASRVAFGLPTVQDPASAAVKFVGISSYVTHEDYESGMVGRAQEVPMPDVALLRLSEDAPAGYVPATMETSKSVLRQGLELTLAGYGVTNGMFSTPTKELRKTNVNVDKPELTSAQFTYRAVGGRTACGGDSGGPAYVSVNGRIKVIGITSWGDSSCRTIGAYTSVPAFADWIRGHSLN